VTGTPEWLASDDLVKIMPRRGTFVTELTTRDITELFDLCLLLESYASDKIIQNGQVPEFLETIHESIDMMSRATVEHDYSDYEAFIEGNRQLHLPLIKATKNTRLVEKYSDLNVHMHIARAYHISSIENARVAHYEHESIVAALKSGGGERVKAELSSHIDTVRRRILKVLKEQGGKL
jgi:DNA-binding GntR family transcriptional regulator